MTTTFPGLRPVEPAPTKSRRVSRRSVRSVPSAPREIVVEIVGGDDPTVYPGYEQMGREPDESDITEALEPMLRRYQAERGITCYVGSDNFIYWVKGNNKACVAPDVYILPGITEKVRPRFYQGANRDEGSWKTWIHRVVPNFALEVKAWSNPRKDELQSPERHDALGTKELIVFDPFSHRRRAPRKRFVVYRRNDAGKLVIVVETNDRRVYSQELGAFMVMDGDDANCMLRLGVGPNGETLLPFESELVDLHARRAEEESRLRLEAMRRAEEESRMRQEATRRAEEESCLRVEAMRRAEEESRRVDALTAELERLRAMVEKRPRRSKKK